MPYRCCVPDCNSQGKWNPIIKFHQMPNDENVRAKWLLAINRLEKDLPKRPRICSKHFVESDYSITRFNYSLSSKNNPSPSRNTCMFYYTNTVDEIVITPCIFQANLRY